MSLENIFTHYHSRKIKDDKERRYLEEFIKKFNATDKFKKEIIKTLQKEMEENNAFLASGFKIEDVLLFLTDQEISAIFKIFSTREIFVERRRLNYKPLTIENVISYRAKDVTLDIKDLIKKFPQWLKVYIWRKFITLKLYPDGKYDIEIHSKKLKHSIEEMKAEIDKAISSK